MPARPADGTACSLIATTVGGGKARCADKGDTELDADLPAGVPAGSYVVGKAYGDGRMLLLNQPGEGGQMWDAAMHERGHLLAAWLCGRADCLNDKFVARGYRDSSSYLRSLTEGFAQSWAQCHGARMRTDYVVIKCADVQGVVDAATAEKAAAKQEFEKAKKSYDESLTAYQQKMREYDDRCSQVDASPSWRTGSRRRRRPAPPNGQPLLTERGLPARPVSYTHLDVYKRQALPGGHRHRALSLADQAPRPASVTLPTMGSGSRIGDRSFRVPAGAPRRSPDARPRASAGRSGRTPYGV